METLPLYIYITFGLTIIITVWLFYKAAHNSKLFLALAFFWIIVQSVISLSGFYSVAKATPPRLPILIVPSIVFITFLFLTRNGKAFIDGLNLKTLTILHVIRVPVELVLLWLFAQKVIPQLMTFEGRNYDILSGVSAPFIYYFGFIKNTLSKNLVLGWNIICVALLANVVFYSVLSAPTKFQRFAFNQPNIALGYFPFVLLPAFLVPLVMFSNLAAIRQLLFKKPVTSV